MKAFYNIAEYMTGALFNIIFIALAVTIVYRVSIYAYDYGKDLFADHVDASYYERTVIIPEDADAVEIGKILEDEGLTSNAWIFYIQSRLNGLYNKFKPGTYTFNSQMGAGEIMDIMQRAQFAVEEEAKITIPEGLNLRQIGELCENKGFFTAQEFLTACGDYTQTYYFLDLLPNRVNPLEGYLFPDTYFLPENPTPEDLINRMLNRFQEIFDFEMEERAGELGMSIDDIVIVASIIEKEIRVSSERALCSSIIHNRMKQGIPLQMCSTVLYVLDKQIDRLLESDLEVDSPYNTYKYAGLPKGPICSPGKAAIQAALNPAETKYLYMVVSDESKGEHFFTNDYSEFLNAKQRYNQRY